jgi:hypothetical protein
MNITQILLLLLALVLLFFFFVLLYAMYLNAVEGMVTTARKAMYLADRKRGK